MRLTPYLLSLGLYTCTLSAQEFHQLKAIDLNGDGKPETIEYRMRPEGLVDVKELNKEPAFSLDVLIRDGADPTSVYRTTVHGLRRLEGFLLDGMKAPVKWPRPMMRNYPELVICLQDSVAVHTIGYNPKSQRYEHNLVSSALVE